MRPVEIIEVYEAGDDRLLILARVAGVTDAAGEPLVLTASGWLSALENHFEPAAYQQGHLKEGTAAAAMTAAARPMNDPERLEYCRQRVREQHPQFFGPERALGISG